MNRFRWKSTFPIRASVANGGADIRILFVLLSNLDILVRYFTLGEVI